MINCDAKILDTILRKQMIISAKKKKQKQKQEEQESDINYLLKNPLEISKIKANG